MQCEKGEGNHENGGFLREKLVLWKSIKNSIYENNICEVPKKVTQINNFGVAAIMSLSSVCVCMQWILGHS